MSSFQPPKKRQRISPLAHFTRRQRPIKRIPSSLLKHKSSVGGTVVSLCHISVKRAEIAPKPVLFKCPPRFSPTPVLENLSALSPPSTRKRPASLIKRPRIRKSELRVYQTRTTFFTLPRELRQAILLQAVDFTELHECARQYRERQDKRIQGSHKGPGFCCHNRHSNEVYRMWKTLVEINSWEPLHMSWPWRDEVDFVWKKWLVEMKSARDCAFGVIE